MVKTLFMKELHGFQKLQLVNLLAEETITYYKLIGYSASVEECTQCNNRIKQIQKELDSRIPADERNILQREHRSAPLEYSF
jgi:7-cyano-7-deazaguanine synthase in queuosine biosynthesis